MARLFSESVKLAWIEFMPDASPLVPAQLSDFGFIVFDTEYLFRGKPTSRALEMFVPTRVGMNLSSGTEVWKGIPREDWSDFQNQIDTAMTSFGLIQTDLLCVQTTLQEDIRERFRLKWDHLINAADAVERDNALQKRD